MWVSFDLQRTTLLYWLYWQARVWWKLLVFDHARQHEILSKKERWGCTNIMLAMTVFIVSSWVHAIHTITHFRSTVVVANQLKSGDSERARHCHLLALLRVGFDEDEVYHSQWTAWLADQCQGRDLNSRPHDHLWVRPSPERRTRLRLSPSDRHMCSFVAWNDVFDKNSLFTINDVDFCVEYLPGKGITHTLDIRYIYRVPKVCFVAYLQSYQTELSSTGLSHTRLLYCGTLGRLNCTVLKTVVRQGLISYPNEHFCQNSRLVSLTNPILAYPNPHMPLLHP